ncbi:EAL domain-containing protein [Aliikangiella coralliicola]|uniref:EAL domain-containing protein n=1 Tax=Aliikangiella coralliicola TaxID=2592383 RepID=A0A545UBY7_9GAMM|nr:EAL domain-containing protein [Aliikangiella coralliicola]TQV86978.1 EAL domain-containing protein [Aliikangiella coralliicola]
MTAKIKTIHLLLLEPSSNQAEVIINSLRNRGFAVRATQVLTTEELAQALERGVSDLLLANTDHPDLSAKQAIEQISTFGRDIPCIVLMKEHDDEALTQAMNYGAKDGVTKDNLPLTCLKVERELASLESRRKKTQAELALKAAEKRCTLLLDNSQDAIAYVHDGMHVYANNAYMELFGYSDHDELLCVPALDMIAKESQDEFRQYLKEMAVTSDQQSFSFGGIKSDMTQFDAIMTLSSANYDDEVCSQLLIRPAADNAELEEKLKELSAQDTLTDLYNKTYFIEQVQQAIVQANDKGNTFNIIYLKYDQHAKIQSEYGIAGVDQITQECSKWLTENLDEEYQLARLGDDCFGLLIPDNSAKKARDIAKELCEKIRSHLFDVEGHTLKLTFSIGICPVGDGSEDAAQVVSDAHSASNRVEDGNGFKVFNKAIHTAGSESDAKMLDKVQDAIESGRIQLMYQPIVKLHGEERSLYQVLLRLSDEDGNMLDSGKVFPVAKAAGLGEKLDRWIIKQAIKSLKVQKAAKDTQLFVSLSGSSLIDLNLVGFIEKTFKAAAIPKSSIVFQIEESDATNHLKRVIALCAELKQKGYSICLANFGADPEQKVLVDQLDADFVRIADDKSQNIHQDPEITEEVQNLLDEIHNRDKQSIIPRVEEAAMLAALWPMNVRYIQGYYLQRPSEKMDYDFSASGF